MGQTFAPHSFKVTSTLSAQRIVAISADNTVALADTIASMPAGITGDTVLDTTSSIPVHGPGSIARLYFNDTVAAGGLVAANASGQGIPAAGTTLTSTYVVGVLVDAAVAATGTVANVLINPHAIYGQV
jgi:hypothetical protein